MYRRAAVPEPLISATRDRPAVSAPAIVDVR
jgi:hypothetical protein